MPASSQVYQIRPLAVILDFDGVIVDSTTAHLAAWSAAVQKLFRQRLDSTADLIGHSTRVIGHILAQRHGDPSAARALADIKEQILIDGQISVPLLGKADEFIKVVHSLGIPICVASNSRSAYVRPILSQKGLLSSFQFIICGDDVALPKPDPAMFRRCAQHLNIKQHEFPKIFVFEDSSFGIKTATDAGMTAIGITSHESANVLISHGATHTYPDLGKALLLVHDRTQ